ncbi:Shr3 amino acid permease chaperone [Choiromyces venosus 120613-1]|uniref:Shr3 amino acid permease chaperone n=1 Tax=Choiromyces venosus 120613-1 TaxID=1336337 RepID=A0A3N4JBR8_9PEZI|nr:Shr3 amino acid permease chaperone [Choiromyces venosus 120613-1]
MSKASFATFLIICPTCFLLGTIFTNWTFDHATLWTSLPPTTPTLQAIESHYAHLHHAPPIIPRVLHITIGTGILGFLAKLYKPSESNMLFDGASLVLYMIALVMYGTNVVKGLRIIAEGEYGEEVGRVDTLRVVAASQVIIALVLVGVLVLQSGQWYAERKEEQEVRGIELEEERERERERDERRCGASASGGKKKN